MFIEQAYKGDNTPWKVLLTSGITMAIFIANLIMFLFSTKEDMDAAYELMKQIPTHLSFIINLGVFIPILVLLLVLVKFMHERSLLSLTTSRKKVDFKRIFFSFSLIFIFTIFSFALGYYLTPENYVYQLDVPNFIILVVLSLILFPFQIGLEEYLFRGFLMQQIGVAAKNKWVPLIVTSVLFGIFHSANPEVAAMGAITMVFYIGTGLLLGIMTLMDEGMELALGFHFGNNFLAATLVTSQYSALQTDSLFMSTSETATSSEIILPVLIVYPIFLIILAYKYKWTGWREKLFGRVEPPQKIIDEHLVAD